ncbi:SCO4225 family membrane protein [Streptomyces viridiviolaceus]
MKADRPIRTLARLTFANPASVLYLSLVGIAVAVAAAEPLWSDTAEGSLVWVWPALFTFPAFGFVAWLGEAAWAADAPAWFFAGGLVVSALVQSLALGATLRALRGRRHEPSRA